MNVILKNKNASPIKKNKQSSLKLREMSRMKFKAA